jgi:hypothetical protein
MTQYQKQMQLDSDWCGKSQDEIPSKTVENSRLLFGEGAIQPFVYICGKCKPLPNSTCEPMSSRQLFYHFP